MNNNKIKRSSLKKIMAIALTVCMLFTLFIPVYGEESQKSEPTHAYTGKTGDAINYVVLGDSMTNGYYMEGFDVDDNSGFDKYVPGTYADVFSKYLNKNNNVNLYQFAYSGMTCDYLRTILDSSYKGNFYTQHWWDNFASLRSRMLPAIKDADIISLCFGTNDVGLFTLYRIRELFLNDASCSEVFEGFDINSMLTETEKVRYAEIKEVVVTALQSQLGDSYSEIVDDKLETVIDTLTYAELAFIEGYSESMKIIRELNPDALIVNVGFMNPFGDFYLNFSTSSGRDVRLNLGTLVDCIANTTDMYVLADAATSSQASFYVDPDLDGGILVTEIGKLDKNTVDVTSPMESEIAHYVCEYLGAAINSFLAANGISGNPFNKDNILAVVGAKQQGASLDQGQTMLYDLYMGIRDAIIDAASNRVINATEFINTATNLNDVLAAAATKLGTDVQSGKDIRKSIYDVLMADDLKDMVLLMDLCLINNGMGAHPSSAGHNSVGEQIISKYSTYNFRKKLDNTFKIGVSGAGGVAVETLYNVLNKVAESGGSSADENDSVSKLISQISERLKNLTGEEKEQSSVIDDANKMFESMLDEYLESLEEEAGETEEYTLSFNTDGGSAVNSVTAVEGTMVDTSEYKPLKAGYEFGGWYLDAALTKPAGTVELTADTVVYAKWTEAQAPVTANPFVDVSQTDYFYEPVLWAVENNITSGMTAKTFEPNTSCTRAQAVTFLWRAAGSPEPRLSSVKFKDVDKLSYYYKAVLWAVQNGITSGTTETSFSPDTKCDRAQIVTFLYRYSGDKIYTLTSTFSDVNPGDYFSVSVSWAVKKGVTMGTSATTFSPYDVCTRGQIVTFLYRAVA